MSTVENKSKTTLYMVYTAMFAVIMAVCSWISIPTNIPFTLQTFAVFLAVGVLGGKYGTMSVLVYLLLGAVGVPVFAGFSGGLGIMLGVTGGYIVGFLFSALVMWLIEALLGKKIWVLALSMVLGLIVCYAFGTIWFVKVYSNGGESISFAGALGMCVVPYIIPDIIKIVIALSISKRVRGLIRLV